MLDQTAPATTLPPRQRVDARAAVSFALKSGRTSLERLSQRGSAKAMMPKVHRPEPEIVFLNTAGGLTGGDRIAFELALAPGARAVATTQTAERAYASLSETGPAEMEVRLRAGAGARLDWLPQETILFERSALHRRTEIDLEGDAECLWCESVVLGREAMGETLQQLDFLDTRMIRRDGVPVMAEPLRLATDTLVRRGAPSGLGGARALATIALIASSAPDLVSRVLPLCDSPGIRASASGWDGKLVVRALAEKPFDLRRWMARVLDELRGQPLPRVWTI
ncbi:urease accessory protein UreD [Mangrovicoccus sp. HB161399]|uniref:urease accessory protein UreD n=1 Tax=Mangrovicoccus sp. HB161399 TaxID=2720392 RepID=UPI001557BE9C|nr:urease accessory protein UreD [Mangrovicoccus sp. HB161399]